MRYLLLSFLAISVSACSAPSLYQEGTLTPTRAHVQAHKQADKVLWAQADNAYVATLAGHYNRHGDGTLSLLITFDPATSNASKASAKAANIAQQLRSYGVYAIHSEVLPVNGDSAIISSYHYYTAQGPKDCQTMPGYADTNIGKNNEYRMGCTVETLIAKQVSNPKDLLGNNQLSPRSEGRSASNWVNAVRAGTFNEPLGGQQASE